MGLEVLWTHVQGKFTSKLFHFDDIGVTIDKHIWFREKKTPYQNRCFGVCSLIVVISEIYGVISYVMRGTGASGERDSCAST